VCLFYAESVEEFKDSLGIQVKARRISHDRGRFIETWRVRQDDSVASGNKCANIAVEITPTARAGAGAMQHDDSRTFAHVVVVKWTGRYLSKMAGG
jgi:hypothetical protein